MRGMIGAQRKYMPKLDPDKLQALREDPDVMRLLQADALLEPLAARLCPNPETMAPGRLNCDLEELCERAKRLLDNYNPTDEQGAEVWELAWHLEMELCDWAERFQGLANLVERLGSLAVPD